MSELYFNLGNIRGLTVAGMQEAAKHAQRCVAIIRDWLPVDDGEQPLSSALTMDSWNARACRECFEFFQFQSPYDYYSTSGPEGAADLWRELRDGMTEVLEHYEWQNVDFDQRLPSSDVRSGGDIAAISSVTLYRIERAANAIVNLPTAGERQERNPPITLSALYELCVGRMNRVGRVVAGDKSTVRGWKKAEGFPADRMLWNEVRDWLNNKKDYDIGPPPSEC